MSDPPNRPSGPINQATTTLIEAGRVAATTTRPSGGATPNTSTQQVSAETMRQDNDAIGVRT